MECYIEFFVCLFYRDEIFAVSVLFNCLSRICYYYSFLSCAYISLIIACTCVGHFKEHSFILCDERSCCRLEHVVFVFNSKFNCFYIFRKNCSGVCYIHLLNSFDLAKSLDLTCYVVSSESGTDVNRLILSFYFELTAVYECIVPGSFFVSCHVVIGVVAGYYHHRTKDYLGVSLSF